MRSPRAPWVPAMLSQKYERHGEAKISVQGVKFPGARLTILDPSGLRIPRTLTHSQISLHFLLAALRSALMGIIKTVSHVPTDQDLDFPTSCRINLSRSIGRNGIAYGELAAVRSLHDSASSDVAGA